VACHRYVVFTRNDDGGVHPPSAVPPGPTRAGWVPDVTRREPGVVGSGLRLVLDARSDAPDIAARALARWLRTVGWPSEDAQDLVFAAREAVRNSVDHAYRGGVVGRVDVDAVVRDDAGVVELTVVDQGDWRASRDAGRRGYGIPLMRAAVSDVVIGTAGPGTWVRLRSGPGPTSGSPSSTGSPNPAGPAS
jgi:anti-sigma regulatory factor (Ser/Thr protein kinase)